MSLNRTEKNSRGYVEKLVLEVESIISEEYKKWMATSQANKVTNKTVDLKEDSESKEPKKEDKQGKKLIWQNVIKENEYNKSSTNDNKEKN